MRTCSPSLISPRSTSPPRRWPSSCWSPIRCTIRTALLRSSTAGCRSRVARAGATRVSACTDRNCSRVAPPAGFRCCRCSGAQSPAVSCMARCSTGSGATSAASNGSPPSNGRGWHAMSTLKGIPAVIDSASAGGARGAAGTPEAVRSGQKYLTAQGFTAIKDVMKPLREIDRRGLAGKPGWLKARPAVGEGYDFVRRTVREHRLATVCEEARCPNIGECWNAGTATIMLLGAVCTRACRFCAVDTGNPRGWLGAEGPQHLARSVPLMRLKYVVLTSVNRDDLPDGGARHYADKIRAIKARNPQTAVEALTPDFQGVMRDVQIVLDSGLDVFAQNVETVRRLTHPVRDPRAGYDQTLEVLRGAKAYKPEVLTKTSLMLGLGETDAEIRETLADLRAAQVDVLTLGQYLRPTPNHLNVERFVTPQQFDDYREWALKLGFLECVSGPLVRSSYRAEQALARNNAGLNNTGLAAKASGT